MTDGIPEDDLRELIEFLSSPEAQHECINDTYAMSYGEYGKHDVLRETLEWTADELEGLLDE